MPSKELTTYSEKELRQLEEKGLYNAIDILESKSGACIIVDGKKMINLASNNYLEFANHKELKKACVETTEAYGVGAGTVRIISGSLKIHQQLEEKTAGFKGTEAAVVSQSEFNCSTSAISATMTKESAILSDELDHVSIIDGCRLSGTTVIRVKHQDMEDLENKAEEAVESKKYKKIMYITDGVFSMDEDIARLPEIIPIAEKYGLITYVDDTHSSGIAGKGAGTVKHFGLSDKIDMQMGTLSKTVGVAGGYVTGSETLIDWLKAESRPLLFSTSLAPGVAASALASISLVQEHPELVEKVWENVNYFKRELKKVGYNIGVSKTPIIPVTLGDEEMTQTFSKKLIEYRIYAKPVVYPTIPLGTGRIRNMPTAEYTEEMLDEIVAIYQKIGKEMEIIQLIYFFRIFKIRGHVHAYIVNHLKMAVKKDQEGSS